MDENEASRGIGMKLEGAYIDGGYFANATVLCDCGLRIDAGYNSKHEKALDHDTGIVTCPNCGQIGQIKQKIYIVTGKRKVLEITVKISGDTLQQVMTIKDNREKTTGRITPVAELVREAIRYWYKTTGKEGVK